MTVTLHLIEQPDGGCIARSPDFAGWRFESPLPVMHPQVATQAEDSLREYAKQQLRFERRITRAVPLAGLGV